MDSMDSCYSDELSQMDSVRSSMLSAPMSVESAHQQKTSSVRSLQPLKNVVSQPSKMSPAEVSAAAAAQKQANYSAKEYDAAHMLVNYRFLIHIELGGCGLDLYILMLFTWWRLIIRIRNCDKER